MSKQTAVEWFLDIVNNSEDLDKNEIDEMIEQAKEMEKEQIVNAFDTGHRIGAWNFLGDEYYEKTFINETK